MLLTKGLFPRRAEASTEKASVVKQSKVISNTATARRFVPRQPFDRFTISSEEEVLFTLGSRRPSRSP